MEIELIKANDFSDGSSRRRIERLRVAAYCRVSTDDEDQIKSYNSMVRYYTDLIQNNKEWVLQVFMPIKLLQELKRIKEMNFNG